MRRAVKAIEKISVILDREELARRILEQMQAANSTPINDRAFHELGAMLSMLSFMKIDYNVFYTDDIVFCGIELAGAVFEL